MKKLAPEFTVINKCEIAPTMKAHRLLEISHLSSLSSFHINSLNSLMFRTILKKNDEDLKKKAQRYLHNLTN